MRIIQQLLIEIYKHNPTENYPLTTKDIHNMLKRIIRRKMYSESYLSRLLKTLKNSGEIVKQKTTCFAFSPNSLDHDFYCSRFCYYLTLRAKKRVRYLIEKYDLK